MRDWIIPATGAMVCWGLWGFLPKITTRFLKPTDAVVFEAIGCFVVGLVVLGLMRGKIHWSPQGMALGLVTGIFGIGGALLYLIAASRSGGRISVVSTYTAIYPVMVVLLAALLLQERPSPRQWLGIALAIVAAVLLAGDPGGHGAEPEAEPGPADGRADERADERADGPADGPADGRAGHHPRGTSGGGT